MKRRKILTLLLTLSLLISLCAAFSVSASAAGTMREYALMLDTSASESDAAQGWAWDATTATLTLDSANIDLSALSGTGNFNALSISGPSGQNVDVTIVLKGNNTIKAGNTTEDGKYSWGIFVDGNCTITGDANSSLSVWGGEASNNRGQSVGIITAGDLTFNSEGGITVLSGLNGFSSTPIYSFGKLSFVSGTVSMTGNTQACQGEEGLSVASNLDVEGSTEYLGSNYEKNVTIKTSGTSAAFAINGNLAKTVRITPKQPEQKPTTDKKNDNGNTLNELLPAILGTLTKEDSTMPFTDVKTSDWYYNSVYGAWENKLIDGATKTLFKPNDTLTVAQAIKLSAALHQLNKAGSVTLTNGTPWYRSYVDYAVANGIIEKAYSDRTAEQLNAPASRSEFVHIFFGAMSDYAALNTVADGKIPDVKMTDKNAKEIYTFYRAGILTGSDSSGTFNAASTIKRSEAAAILNRMFDASERQTITLK